MPAPDAPRMHPEAVWMLHGEIVAQAVKFKFRYLDDKGNETGFFSKKGSFDGQQLILDKETIPIDAVIRAMRRFNRLLLILSGDDDQAVGLTIAVQSGNIAKLHSSINMIASERHARHRLEYLTEQSRANEFRIETCPHCQSTIDLSGMAPSLQVHCSYCDVIATLDVHRPGDESKYRHCDQCKLFSQPKGFTVFYFYFLVFVYGYSQRKMYTCNACMRAEAWKMLAGNLFFLLGVPIAIIQLFRAYFGGSRFSEAFAGLDKANALSTGGKCDRAVELYEKIARRHNACAGVRCNMGLTLSAAGQWPEAAVQFEHALKDCANYTVAAEALYGCYERLGDRQADADALRRQWEEDDDPLPAPGNNPEDAPGSNPGSAPGSKLEDAPEGY